MGEFTHTDPDGDRLGAEFIYYSNRDRVVGIRATDHGDENATAVVHLDRKAVKRLRKFLKKALKEAS